MPDSFVFTRLYIPRPFDPSTGEIRSVSFRHDRQGLRRRQDRTMAGPRMIGMTVGDHGAIHRPHRIDVEITGRAIEAGGRRMQQVFGSDHEPSNALDDDGRRRHTGIDQNRL